MTSHSPCPDLDALQRLALDQLSPAEAFTLHRHLVRCVVCAQTVEDLKAAGKVLAVPPAGAAVAAPPERLERTPAPVRRPDPEAPTIQAPVQPVQGFSFLSPPQQPGELGRLGGYR